MKMAVDVWDMKKAFEELDLGYYSVNGLETLLDYYDEIDENMEFDPIAICCDCTEYGKHGAAMDFTDLINDYSYKYSPEEWESEQDPDELKEMNEGEKKERYILELIAVLDACTTVLHVPNGNYIIFTF